MSNVTCSPSSTRSSTYLKDVHNGQLSRCPLYVAGLWHIYIHIHIWVSRLLVFQAVVRCTDCSIWFDRMSSCLIYIYICYICVCPIWHYIIHIINIKTAKTKTPQLDNTNSKSHDRDGMHTCASTWSTFPAVSLCLPGNAPSWPAQRDGWGAGVAADHHILSVIIVSYGICRVCVHTNLPPYDFALFACTPPCELMANPEIVNWWPIPKEIEKDRGRDRDRDRETEAETERQRQTKTER